MDTRTTFSLDMLPVELLHHIFDSLDAETILFSVKYVCKRLDSATINYDRYELNFKTIYKNTFHEICCTSDPKNIISLTLSNENETPGQIELFLSLYRIEEYTRLQSVTLMAIEQLYLNKTLKHLSTAASLTHLVIHEKSNTVMNAETLLLLSITMGQKMMRKIDLNLTYMNADNLQWPQKCWVQYIRLSHSIRFNKFSKILHSSPYVKTMILRDCIIYDIEEINHLIADNKLYRQLKSLTLEDSDLKMPIIESLLSLTPSLIHLTLNGSSNDLFDGFRWEQFIQNKLPGLNKFRFAFQSDVNVNHDIFGLKSLIKSFQTVFWLETKQWQVTAICVRSSNLINIFTIPDCAEKINFHPKANKITYSSTLREIGKTQIIENVCEMSLDLMEMQIDMTEKAGISTDYFFNKLNKLRLKIHGNWPNHSLALLSSLIDLGVIAVLTLDVNFTIADSSNTTTGIVTLLEKASNVQSLIIHTHTLSLKAICSFISNRIKHLQICVRYVEDMTMVLKRFDHLSSVTFTFLENSVTLIAEVILWIVTQGMDFTYQSTQNSLSLWLGKSQELHKN